MKSRAFVRGFAGIVSAVGLWLVLGWATESQNSCRACDSPDGDGPEEVLRDFLRALSKKEVKRAHALVAPSTKDQGDPITTGSKADSASFAAEVAARSPEKFGAYELGKRRAEGKDRVRIFVHFQCGDTDETLLVREGGRWYVADPIHIIR